ncbi:unnamed protein product [Ilex paraguariensis]|uniref:Uncharacterized protein n=1 Tax=Ilex paraguariensis TaxID=185542 RepID=A0ABC8R2P4_9AQUA
MSKKTEVGGKECMCTTTAFWQTEVGGKECICTTTAFWQEQKNAHTTTAYWQEQQNAHNTDLIRLLKSSPINGNSKLSAGYRNYATLR